MSPKLLISTLAFHPQSPSAAARWATEQGFDGLEVLCEPPWLPSQWPAGERRAVAGARLHLSLHAPVADVNLMSPHPGARKLAEGELAASVELAAELEAPWLTFHLGGRPIMGVPHQPPWQEARQALHRLAKRAAALGVGLGLENDPRLPGLYLCDLEEFARFLGETGLAGVLDVGHAWTVHGREAVGKLTALVPRLRGAHLHDNDGVFDAHLGLGEGSVDVEAVWPSVSGLEFIALEAACLQGLRRSHAFVLGLPKRNR